MKYIESRIITALLAIVWVGGGLALDRQITLVLGTVVSCAWLGWVYYKQKKLIFPRYFLGACFLVLIALVSVGWSASRLRTIEEVLLTTSGLLWWVGATTLANNKRFNTVVRDSILLAGGIFTALWLAHVVYEWPSFISYGSSSLVVEASWYMNHNHLGDWWMVMLVLMWRWSGIWTWFIPGLVMVFEMKSRSAVIGLMGGWGYIAWVQHWLETRKKLVIMLAVFLSFLFVGLGVNKSTLGTRDYFIQAVAGLGIHPFGVGLGNFGVISLDKNTHWWGRDGYSSIVHNLPLEWIVGMGWLGFVGWVWLARVSWNMGTYQDAPYGASQGRKTSLRFTTMWRAVYWALLINFMFDTTYFIPSMWWLFMTVMGLAEHHSAPGKGTE